MLGLQIYCCSVCRFWSYSINTKTHEWLHPDDMPVPDDTEEVLHVLCPLCKPKGGGIYLPGTSHSLGHVT